MTAEPRRRMSRLHRAGFAAKISTIVGKTGRLANECRPHPGLVLKASVPVNTPIKTVEGETFTLSPALVITDQRVRQANIVATDVLASNGVIHVLDKVILPAP